MFFGTIEDAASTTGEVISVNAQTAATSFGANVELLAIAGTSSRGEIDITGAINADIYVTLDSASVTLHLDGDVDQTHTVALTLSNGTDPELTDEEDLTVDGLSLNLGAGGESTAFIGGTLTVGSESAGFYRGEVTVTVSYF